MGLLPFRFEASGDGEGDEDEGEDGDQEDDTDDVELPEEGDNEFLEAEHLEGGLVVGEAGGFLCSAVGNVEGEDEGNGGCSVDDGPHANAPSPADILEGKFADIAADPGVDLNYQ